MGIIIGQSLGKGCSSSTCESCPLADKFSTLSLEDNGKSYCDGGSCRHWVCDCCVVVLVGDGVVATSDDGNFVDATTTKGMVVATKDGDGDGATNGAWANDPGASLCNNTLIT